MRAAAAGVVRIADRSLVEVEHSDGLRTGYYHLRSSSLAVAPGDVVEAGAPLGNPSCEHRRGGVHSGHDVCDGYADLLGTAALLVWRTRNTH